MNKNPLNLLKIAGILLVGLTAVILMGLAVTEGFSKELRTSTTNADFNLTFGQVNVTTTYSNLPYIQTMATCTNATNASAILTNNVNYTFQEGNGDGGKITLLDPGSTYNGTAVNCSVTYLAASTGSGVGDNFISGLAIFGSFIGVVILAIIGMVIIGIFRKAN